MIINLRGTSGSGKSTIVNQVMEKFDTRTPYRSPKVPKRKQPLGYILTRKYRSGYALDAVRKLFVVGHYETPCGGCDTLSFPGSQDMIWELIRHHHNEGYDVLFEGVIIGDDVKRTLKAHEDGLPLLLIELTTPLSTCLEGIQSRRNARGDKREINPKNTSTRMPGIHKRMLKFKDVGLDVRHLARQGALDLCLEKLC